MKARLKMRGADIRMQTNALAVDPHTGSVRIEDHVIVRTDRLVVTAGAWTPQLFPALGILFIRIFSFRQAVCVRPAAWTSARNSMNQASLISAALP